MNICFVHAGLSTFVKRDLEILQEQYSVRESYFRGIRSVFTLLRVAFWCDVTFTWFGALPAFFAVLFSKLFGKISIVVAGGYDVARVPEINYGLFASPWKKYFPLFTFRYADLIICVSESNKQEAIVNARVNPNKIRLVYHGFNSETFKKQDAIEKEELVLTVGNVNKGTLSKKGLEVFVESARYLPDKSFYLVGPWQDNAINYLKRKAPNNVEFYDGIFGKELIDIYSRAQVYVQASIHESFGCSIAEAMLCECIPVVTRKAAIPEVVGECGLYVDTNDPSCLATTVDKAFSSDLGEIARARIIELFPLQKHADDLINAVEELTAKY